MNMIGEWIRFILTAVFLLFGVLMLAFATFGVFRFRYVLNRMHNAAMGDSLGILFVMVGLSIASGWTFATMKMLLIVLFFWLAGPVSSHLICRLEVATNEELEKECEVPEHGKL